MQVTLIAVGRRMPAWVDEAFAAYAVRMPPECRIELIEVPTGTRRPGTAPDRAVTQEGERMLAKVRPGSDIIALDERGSAWNTRQLAGELRQWMTDAREVALLIGGPDGLASECLARAGRKWSLSPLTLPHGLVRVIVAEQLYRAWSILSNHPYHRE